MLTHGAKSIFMKTIARATRGSMRKLVLATLGVLFGAGLLAAVYAGLTWDLRAREADPAAEYQPSRIERGSLRETVIATGTMAPFARIVVQSEIPGIVKRVLVDDGDRVERDQALVELDGERLEDRVAELTAQLTSRQALGRYDLVGKAKAVEAKAAQDQNRIQGLFDRGVISTQAIEDAEHTVRLAKIAITDAQAETAARAANVEETRNALRRAERDLAKTVIRSPVDGVVERREVEVGTAVADLQNGGTVIAVLADDARIHLLADVDENDVADIRVGQKALVRIDAFSGETFTSRVRKIASSGKSDGGSVSEFDVEIEVDPDPRIRVGMSADARIVVREHLDALLVPNSAIVRTEDGPKVRVPDGDSSERFHLVPISELYSDGFRTAIDKGLSVGDVVLVRGGPSLRAEP